MTRIWILGRCAPWMGALVLWPRRGWAWGEPGSPERWVPQTIGGLLMVMSAALLAHALLAGARHMRLVPPERARSARSGLRLVLGALVLGACTFPFLLSHAPALALALMVGVGALGWRRQLSAGGRPPHHPSEP